jgi:hypothetical protein
MTEIYKVDGFWFMVFNTTCKYISVISLWSVLLVEGTLFFTFELYFADPSCILNGQDVYMYCLDGLVQTHLVS